MSLKIKLLSICTAAAIAASVLAMGVAAVAPSAVRISQGDRELRKGRTLKLAVSIRPSDADESTDYYFYSDDPDIADVDSDGVVTAYEPGTTKIHVETGNKKTDSITITVPGAGDSSSQSSRDSDGRDTDLKSSSSSRSSSTSSSKATAATTELTEKLSRETLLTAVTNAGTSKATLSNYDSVSADSLKAASAAGATGINFDTKSGKSTLGRLVISPANAKTLTGDIKLGVWANSSRTKSVQDAFDENYSNRVTVIRCDQGSYGMSVEVVAKVGKDVNAESLKFYSYSSAKNTFTDLSVSKVTVDNSGFVHFTTTTGGYILVSDGVLK